MFEESSYQLGSTRLGWCLVQIRFEKYPNLKKKLSNLEKVPTPQSNFNDGLVNFCDIRSYYVYIRTI
jgi:hypothetical protein